MKQFFSEKSVSIPAGNFGVPYLHGVNSPFPDPFTEKSLKSGIFYTKQTTQRLSKLLLLAFLLLWEVFTASLTFLGNH